MQVTMRVTNEHRPMSVGTKHRLTAVIEGTVYEANYTIDINLYAALDPKDARKIVESYLWQQLMHTIEHHLRKNLTHA